MGFPWSLRNQTTRREMYHTQVRTYVIPEQRNHELTHGRRGNTNSQKTETPIIKMVPISNRVICIMVRVSSRYYLQMIQVFATDIEIEQFYEDRTAAKQAERTDFVIMVGDFNAKLADYKND